MGREIRAVKAGLKGLYEADAVTAAAAIDADPLDKGPASAEGGGQEVAVKPEAPAAPEEGAASAAGSQLQRATMLQRLEALRAKKAQLQVGPDAHVGCSCTLGFGSHAIYTWRCHQTRCLCRAYQMQPAVPNQPYIGLRKADAPCKCCVSVPATLAAHLSN